ncbi:MAG: hypothetical protein RQ743_03665 [Bacteroidales bacterium]|nr:hypothetical protein [Bacteroidales bacterium]
MYRLMRIPSVSRLTAFCIMVSFLLMTNGCYYFRVNRSAEPPGDILQKMESENRLIILHIDDNVWVFSGIKTEDQAITGKISGLKGHRMYTKVIDDHPGPYRYKGTQYSDEREVLNEVHIYASEMETSDRVSVSIPVEAIQKIDVYDRDAGATLASWTFSILGAAAAVFGVVSIIVLLTKSSCPFIYGYDGTDYVFYGEVFSGAVQPGLERDDYFPLPLSCSEDGTYKIKMANEVKEIQYVDLAELLLVDHKEGTEVLFDKYGVPHSISRPVQPISANTFDNTDILHLVNKKDTVNYTGLEKVTDDNYIEEIYLKFIRPENAKSAKLVMNAKNSFWMEAVITKIHELFGEKYDKFIAKQEKKSGARHSKYQLDQEMPMSVYIEKNKRWEFVDYFNLPGAMALRNDILPINLEGLESDTISIKISTGFGFWEVDYLAMDFGLNESLEPLTVKSESAISSDNADISKKLSATDSDYYVLGKPGDEAVLEFVNPEMKGECRSAFLHTRGYYKIVRELSGPPDKKTLRAFRKPGMIPSFSKEAYKKIYNN